MTRGITIEVEVPEAVGSFLGDRGEGKEETGRKSSMLKETGYTRRVLTPISPEMGEDLE